MQEYFELRSLLKTPDAEALHCLCSIGATSTFNGVGILRCLELTDMRTLVSCIAPDQISQTLYFGFRCLLDHLDGSPYIKIPLTKLQSRLSHLLQKCGVATGREFNAVAFQAPNS